ncbi:hypothetical protein [Parvularcula marina]
MRNISTASVEQIHAYYSKIRGEVYAQWITDLIAEADCQSGQKEVA